MLDHVEIMKEAVSILRGENAGWKGDRIYNAECYCHTIKRDMPQEAVILAEDLRNNKQDYSDLLGIHPDRVVWFANRLTK